MQRQLTASQTSSIVNMLEERRRVLEERLRDQHGGSMRVSHDQDTLAQESDDAPRRAAERELDISQSNVELNEVDAIGHALHRVYDDTFGACIDCARPIPFARLAVEPQALRCVNCQTLLESTS